MMQTADEISELQAFRARSTLIQTVREWLKGQGLDIRERNKELVISAPGHPESGSIYITYATAEVSHRHTVWQYLGPLEIKDSERDPDEPGVGADTIINALIHHIDSQWLTEA